MRIRVVKEFSALGVALPEGREGEVVRHGLSDGLPGVEDGTYVYVAKSSVPLSFAERKVMEAVAEHFPEAREHMREGIAVWYVPADHVEVIYETTAERCAARVVTVEGPIGSGKTLLAGILVGFLRERGVKVNLLDMPEPDRKRLDEVSCLPIDEENLMSRGGMYPVNLRIVTRD